MSWIDDVVKYTEGSEAPERYFWWSALTAISATVMKRVYLDRYFYKLYPNIYTLLISARPGLRKGIPVGLMGSLLEELGNVRIISGRNSIQGVIKELSTQRTMEGGAVVSDAQGILLADEFSSFLVHDPEAMTILTSLYNAHEHEKSWKNTLRNSPVENLKKPCICLLGASNERLFEEIVKNKDIEGGFISRTFIVYEKDRRCINPLTRKPETMSSSKEMAGRLKEIAALEGGFKWTDQSIKLYEKWYADLCNSKMDDRTGSIERLGDQVLKVAMLISLASDNDLNIKHRVLQEAIDRTEECVLGALRVSMGFGASESAPAVARVLKVLLYEPEHKISRQKLLKRVWPDVDSIMLDRVVETLTQSGAIESIRCPKVGVTYVMPESVYKQYQSFKGEL